MVERPKIVIVGGGFTGAAAAIHLSRMASRALDIRLIEGRKDVGRGVAYETEDPAHRLNVPPKIMILYPDDIGHFERYVDARQISRSDPDAVAADGSIYPRREVFGDYMVAELAAEARENPSRSEIRHLRDRALSVTRANGGFRIRTEAGEAIDGDAVLTCLSRGQPSGLPGLAPELRHDPRLVADPWDGNALAGIGVRDRVLIVGTGLTAADVVMSLQLRGHLGSLVMLSRHGLPPNRQPDFGDIQALLSRLSRAEPVFIERHGQPASVREVLRAVRSDIKAARQGDAAANWCEEFDHVRDAGGAIWRQLSVGEKQRFQRHLSSYYSAHRNRVAPQLIDCLSAARADGRLVMRAGRFISARPAGERIAVRYRLRHQTQSVEGTFDAIVNCTGPTHSPDAAQNPFVQSAVDNGLARADPFGLGLDVDEHGSALNADGSPSQGFFVAGPLTRGFFGDVVGAVQIAVQLQVVLPALLQQLYSCQLVRRRT